MKVLWSPEAERALCEILDCIAKDSPENAYRFISKLKTRAQDLVQFPSSGKKVPEWERDDLRELIEGNYRIIYRIHAETVEIVTVFEGHRLLRVLREQENATNDAANETLKEVTSRARRASKKKSK